MRLVALGGTDLTGARLTGVNTETANHDFPASDQPNPNYIRALRLNAFLEQLGNKDYFAQAVKAASRPNGSMSFAKLLDLVEVRAALALIKARRAGVEVRGRSEKSMNGDHDNRYISACNDME